MITFRRCCSADKAFHKLIAELDADLCAKNGKLQNTYCQFNTLGDLSTVIVAEDSENPVGCGCFKRYDYDTAKIKRVYVIPGARGKGVAKQILSQLETWAKESGYRKLILETGRKNIEAVGLYEKRGYQRIDNYGPYVNLNNSICFTKQLS